MKDLTFSEPARDPGTYLLRFDLAGHVDIDIGRRGTIRLSEGVHYYVGSAFGPGGVAARVMRHVSGNGKRHWHVDALRARQPVVEVYYSHAAKRLEHAWASVLLALPGAVLEVPGFGASDCRCPGHLVWFRRPPPRRMLHTVLGGSTVRRWNPLKKQSIIVS